MLCTIWLKYTRYTVVGNIFLYKNQNQPIWQFHRQSTHSLYDLLLLKILKIIMIRFDITMENAMTVHMFNCFEELVHVIFDFLLRKIMSPSFSKKFGTWNLSRNTFDRVVQVIIHQFKHQSKTSGRFITNKFTFPFRSQDWYYRTSKSLTICEWGDNFFKAWISRRLLTWKIFEISINIVRITCSRESKWFFMHLMATYLLFWIDWAMITSENVPPPFFLIRRYSKGVRKSNIYNYFASLICKTTLEFISQF